MSVYEKEKLFLLVKLFFLRKGVKKVLWGSNF